MGLRLAAGTALPSIQRGMEALQRNAAETAGARGMDGNAVGNLARPLVEQVDIASRVEASVRVLQAEDRLLGALLDLRA